MSSIDQLSYAAIINALMYIIIYSCLPIILMFSFGILILININQQQRLIASVNLNRRIVRQNTRLNNQLLKMLLVQIIVISVTTFPTSVQIIYDVSTSYLTKSPYRIAQEQLFFQISEGFSYVAHSTSFYFFTLSGTIFRQELKRLFTKFIHYFPCVNNNIRVMVF
jgi:hypothetical protein